MYSKRRVELEWLIGMGAFVLYVSFYTISITSLKEFPKVIIGFLIFLIPTLVCLPIKTMTAKTEQVIFSISITLCIAFFVYIAHSYALVPLIALMIGIYGVYLFYYAAVRYLALCLTALLWSGLITAIVDKSYLTQIDHVIFYISLLISQVGLIMFVIASKSRFMALKDADEQKNKAIEANQSKSTFLANMSHEIRTPMNAILGMSELLLLDDITDTEKEYVNTIHNSSKTLLNIINDILDFSKIDAGKMEFIEERYDFESVMQDVSNLIENRLKDKTVIFTIQPTSNLPSVLLGDEVRLKQVLINVISNSCKHTSKGHIMLSIDSNYIEEDKSKAELTFVVKDTGSGIPKNDLEHIFDAFNRADAKKNRNIEGTGLGLAITKRLVEAMGGSVTIDSEYGIGTTVTIKVIQTVADATEWVKVANPEKYDIYVYETNQHYREAFANTFEQLKLKYIFIATPDEIDEKVKDSDNAFLFYSYAASFEAIKAKKEKFKETRFVGIVKMFDVVPEEVQMRETLMHSFSIPKLLAILENRNIAPKTEEKALKVFSAPKVKVLVVDDNPVNLKVARSMMGLFDLNVSTASNGMDCLKLLEQGNKYDIIFMDHMMPQMDGIETTQRIRAIEKGTFEHNIVIALTANAIKGVEKMFLDAGLDDYIFKPMDLVSLEAILRKWIDPQKQHEKE
ncbi:MAG: response regulator [Lachnospiraceae bacterium]|nr:response regulator [Lachnospiraceae bacterium]